MTKYALAAAFASLVSGAAIHAASIPVTVELKDANGQERGYHDRQARPRPVPA